MRSVWAVAPLVGDVISISGGSVSRRTMAVSWPVRPTASVACAIISLSPSEFKGRQGAQGWSPGGRWAYREGLALCSGVPGRQIVRLADGGLAVPPYWRPKAQKPATISPPLSGHGKRPQGGLSGALARQSGAGRAAMANDR